MKTLSRLGCLSLLIVLMTSCQPAASGIQPGDTVGSMQFVSDRANCRAPNISELCTFESLFDGTCLIPPAVDTFWVSSGWREGSAEALELAWKDSTWSMTFDDRAVDLAAFGTRDLDSQLQAEFAWDLGRKSNKEQSNEDDMERMWAVCIVDPAPGRHTVRYEFLMKNGVWRGNHVQTFTFTVMADQFP